MQNTYTAVIKQDGEWWIGWVEEIPGVNCQESTKEELLETLKVTLGEAIALNREEALRSAETGYVEEPLQVQM
jgi:predicted RNase H-like HicB family nuclease